MADRKRRFEYGDAEDPASVGKRLFLVGCKDIPQSDISTAFEKYGQLTDVWKLENKGVCYITFAKASDAAIAKEELTGKSLPGQSKLLKIIYAHSKSMGSVAAKEDNEMERFRRLFIKIPKSWTEAELKEKFSTYGEIKYTKILKDNLTGESKGLAYVKFFRTYHACKALEECGQEFRAVFAESRTETSVRSERLGDVTMRDAYGDPRAPPRGTVSNDRYGYDRYGDGYASSPSTGSYSSFADRTSNFQFRAPPPSLTADPWGRNIQPMDIGVRTGPWDILRDYKCRPGENEVEAKLYDVTNERMLRTLMDMVPGMVNFEVDQISGDIRATYSHSECAAYAADKLRVSSLASSVKTCQPLKNADVSTKAAVLAKSMESLLQSGQLPSSVQTLVEPMQQVAASVLKEVAPSTPAPPDPWGSAVPDGLERVAYTSVPLPPRQPITTASECAMRLFIVAKPTTFDYEILRDLFCRFGNLIKVYWQRDRNFGYASYGSEDSARNAMETLHLQTVCGVTLKVIEAEPVPTAHNLGDEPDNKRSKNDY